MVAVEEQTAKKSRQKPHGADPAALPNDCASSTKVSRPYGGSCQAQIGPDSILFLVPVIREVLGPDTCDELLHVAHIRSLPSGHRLTNEDEAAALHQQLRRRHPDDANLITSLSGQKTGDHIIEQRMPEAARRVLQSLPEWLAAPLLAKIIGDYAWTFSGSGKVQITSRFPVIIDIYDNPIVRGEKSKEPVCQWHAAVFERLFRRMVDDRLRCVETQCCAQGKSHCRFEII